ncbi:uncharacterized protein LOC130806889 [Amaranthus tricolor]|uniref:uncharacterized protein LOC130806889 n=1 Tax=Amaranthus tricolor TaxID=29722 RepID=UPI00258E0597|nr:uncharacterized protein LOC130806889 [Amaranthus tricolor]
MGREWYLNWGTKSSSKKGRTNNKGGGGGIGRKSSTPPPVAAAAAAATAGGCMNAVLHMFDFQLCLHPQDSSFLPDDHTSLKGLEAPRNSLESIEEKEKDDYQDQFSKRIQVKTNRKDTGLKLVQTPRSRIEDFSSDGSSPASVRTPTLVARLMGLDILPESNTTTPRSSHSHILPHLKTTTKPTTNKPNGPSPSPQRSSSISTRRRAMDVVDHHRLSLQINKENSIVKEMELSRPSCSSISTKRKEGKKFCHEEEVTKSPSYYARQIMKQVRESVSRRVGVDITNTISNGNKKDHYRRDEHLLSYSLSKTRSSKPKKIKKNSSYHDENNKVMSMNSKIDHQHQQQQQQQQKTMVDRDLEQKMVRENNEDMNVKKMNLVKKKPFLKSYDSLKNKKDEQFVRASMNNKKSKTKTMLSSDLIHGTIPSVVTLKNKTTTKLLDKEGTSSNVQFSKPIMKNTSIGTTITTTTTTSPTSRLSRYPRQGINEKIKAEEKATHVPADHWKSRPKDATTNSVMEFQYITKILKCTGIDRDTPISFMRWFLPSHPLDPSIYHNLEATHYLTTSDKFACDRLNLSINRKLIFHLVDEMLADILKPYVDHHYHYLNYVDKHHYQHINGFQLVKILCTKIRSFPCSNCQTLQDIDALVEKDMQQFGRSSNLIDDEDEGEEIVSTMVGEIMDSLVQEICCTG